MPESQLSKFAYALRRLVLRPGRSLAYLRLAHLAEDRGFKQQAIWVHGGLARVPLASKLAGAEAIEVRLPRVMDRTWGTSMTTEEASALCVIEKYFKVRRILEIGTFDGNTTLAMAANLEEGGSIVTVDLPPDFDAARDRAALAAPGEAINLTPRDRVGIQFRSHPLAARIRQTFGDSAALDWETLGGPFDLVFIDGSHTAAYVRSDTRNALQQLAPTGVLVWHDYGQFEDVSTVVDEVARATPGLQVFAVEGTRLAVGVRGALPGAPTPAAR